MLRILLSGGVFLATLAACLWATVAVSRGPIERDLTRRSLEALDGIEGFRAEDCELSFLGRDGLLRGDVPTAAMQEEVEEVLAEIYGVRVMETDLVVRPFESPRLLVERRADGSILIDGLLSADAGKVEDGELIAGLEDAGELVVDVEYGDRVSPADWLEPLTTVAMQLLPVAEGARVAIADGKLSLAGELVDAEMQALFEEATREEFSVAGVDVAFDFALTLAVPPEPAFFRLLPPADGQVVVEGRLADLDVAQGLLTMLRAGGDWIVKDQIVVDENTEDAPWVEALGFVLPSLLTEVVDAGLEIEGDRVRIDGQISEEMLVAITDVAAQNFPVGEYVVENRLRVMTPPKEAMVSVLTFPGKVQLKGLVAEAGMKDRILAAARGAIGSDVELVSDELVVDANSLEASWVDPLVKLIPPYVKRVKRGGLTIYSNILAVEAVIESDSDRDFIWAMTEQYFPDDKYRRLLELRFPEEVEGGIAGEADPAD